MSSAVCRVMSYRDGSTTCPCFLGDKFPIDGKLSDIFDTPHVDQSITRQAQTFNNDYWFSKLMNSPYGTSMLEASAASNLESSVDNDPYKTMEVFVNKRQSSIGESITQTCLPRISGFVPSRNKVCKLFNSQLYKGENLQEAMKAIEPIPENRSQRLERSYALAERCEQLYKSGNRQGARKAADLIPIHWKRCDQLERLSQWFDANGDHATAKEIRKTVTLLTASPFDLILIKAKEMIDIIHTKVIDVLGPESNSTSADKGIHLCTDAITLCIHLCKTVITLFEEIIQDSWALRHQSRTDGWIDRVISKNLPQIVGVVGLILIGIGGGVYFLWKRRDMVQ